MGDDKTEFEMEQCALNHKIQVDQVYSKIKQLKKLYARKLPVYRDQLKNSEASSPLRSSNIPMAAEGTFFNIELEQEESKGPLRQPLTSIMTEIDNNFSQDDTKQQKKQPQDKRRPNKDRFSKNRIVELVYG